MLVAEDLETDVFILKRAFTRAGVNLPLKFVRDGQEVIDYLEGRGPYWNRFVYPLPRVLVLDLKMPRLNGFDVLEWARTKGGFKRLVKVILTSSYRICDVNRAYDLGANSYVVKPM